ncbi:MAG: serine/threonine-protein kinase [Planctomycetota bacterium]
MLDPADIVAAKIVHQLGWAPLDALIEALRQLHADQGGAVVDLLLVLQLGSYLSPEQVTQVRHYTARFQVVFHEAAFLRELERRGVEPSEVVELLAIVESSGHERRLAQLLHERGTVDAATIWEIEDVTLRNVRGQDARVVRRYAQQGFARVARPLIPDGTISEDTFRVSRIFRDRATQAHVLRAIVQRQITPPEHTKQVPVEELGVYEGQETLDIDMAPFRLRGPKAQGDAMQTRTAVAHYRVLECLGSGGMGAVYLADAGVGQIVAIKVLQAKRASAGDLARFEREAQISSLIDHPGVVRLLEAGRTPDGLCYMVIPPYPGTSLRTLLQREEVTQELAFSILEQLADALEAVHQEGVVHRDVKPENVLVLAGSDQVKLVDFGIARFYERGRAELTYVTARGTISGSPAYLAPETIVGEPSHPLADLYSYGVLAYELLTGQPPFEASSTLEFVERHLYRVPQPLSERRPDLHWSPDLERLVSALLAKVPDQRPRSAGYVRDLLRGGLSARSLELLRGEVGERSSRLYGSFEA